MILRPDLKSFIFRWLCGYLPLVLVLCIFIVAIEKIPFLKGDFSQFPKSEFLYIISLTGLLVIAFDFVLFIFNFYNFWTISSDGVVIRRFLVVRKLIPFVDIKSISGAKKKVLIIGNDWKVISDKSDIGFDDFIKFQKLWITYSHEGLYKQ